MARRQITSHILMVRPAHFAFNDETARNNAFQTKGKGTSPADVRKQARKEFDAMVKCLRAEGVQVVVCPDSYTPRKPDAVFPNNWLSFHQEGILVTYPMFAPNRRKERRRRIIDLVLQEGFESKKRINLEFHEKIEQFLEGTGSIVFDHPNQLAYACISDRTHAPLLKSLCQQLNYTPVTFQATDKKGIPVYHTNVLMCVGESFALICMDALPNKEERNLLENHFKTTNKEVIKISLPQMESFAGNMLQICSSNGERLLVMSDQAYTILTNKQIKKLESHSRILHPALYTIEKYGGGSARCMMAEIFLPKK